MQELSAESSQESAESPRQGRRQRAVRVSARRQPQDFPKHKRPTQEDSEDSSSEQKGRHMQLRGAVSRAFGIHEMKDDDDEGSFEGGGRRGRKENGLVELTKKFISLLKEAPN
jgi:hypothetical protein